MADSFDPYHKWLGISPKEQPPTHYRLLGIDSFEGDPDVIEAAADQRMAHVRTYQTGPNSALSQKILNELAGAKLCLLAGAKRAAYDAQLRQRIATAAPVASSPSSRAVGAASVESAHPPAISLRAAAEKRKSNNATAVMASAVAAIALFSAAAFWYFGSNEVQPQAGDAARIEEKSKNRSVASRPTDASFGQSAKTPRRESIAPQTDAANSGPIGVDKADQVREPDDEKEPPQPTLAPDKTASKPDDPPHKGDEARPAPEPPDGASATSKPQANEPASERARVAAPASFEIGADGVPAAGPRELPRFHPTGKWLDALNVTDPLEHLVQGDWMRGRKGLQATAGSAAAMMEIPVDVEGSYDFQTQFTRTSGEGPLAVTFPVGVDRAQFALNSAADEAGLAFAENVGPKKNDIAASLALSNNHRYTLELRVRVLNEEAAHVEAYLDKEEILVWDGARAQLQVARESVVPSGIRFALLSGPGATVGFHVVRVRSMNADEAPRSRTSLKPRGAVIKLRIAAKVDGRDRLQIGAAQARWSHETWSWPTAVRFCGVEWSPQQQPGMPFDPRLKNALLKADFQSAQLSKISGRGEIRLERSADGIDVIFDDDAAGFGADDYEAVVTLLRDK